MNDSDNYDFYQEHPRIVLQDFKSEIYTEWKNLVSLYTVYAILIPWKDKKKNWINWYWGYYTTWLSCRLFYSWISVPILWVDLDIVVGGEKKQ